MSVQQQKQGHHYSPPEPISQDHPVDAPMINVDTEDVDDLLNEIDEVLEENAQEFVAGYVQQGGQ